MTVLETILLMMFSVTNVWCLTLTIYVPNKTRTRKKKQQNKTKHKDIKCICIVFPEELEYLFKSGKLKSVKHVTFLMNLEDYSNIPTAM